MKKGLPSDVSVLCPRSVFDCDNRLVARLLGGVGRDCGPCGRERQGGPPGDGEEKDRGCGEDAESADGGGDVERLGGSDSRGEQRGGVGGADLRRGSGGDNRECCGCRAGAEEEERSEPACRN
jgi:hypothetical protein